MATIYENIAGEVRIVLPPSVPAAYRIKATNLVGKVSVRFYQSRAVAVRALFDLAKAPSVQSATLDCGEYNVIPDLIYG